MNKLYIPINIQRFATSGSYDSGGGYNGKRLGFYWSRIGYSNEGGYSDIYWEVRGLGGSGYHYLHALYVGLNYQDGVGSGETYHEVYATDDANLRLYDGTVVTSGTARIYHNADGSNGHFRAIMTGAVYTFAWNIQNTYGDFYLDNLSRYFTSTPSISSANITETGFKINWTTSETRDWSQYSLNGGGWTDAGDTGNTSGTINFSNLSSNAQYTVKCRFRRADSQLWSESNTITVKTYAYPYITSAGNFTVGNNNTISFYNPLGRKITIEVQANGGSWNGGDTSTGTSITGYSNSGWRNYWYQNCTSKTSNTYRARVTYNGVTNTTGYSYTYTISESANSGEAKPTFSDFSLQDTNSTILALTGNNQRVVLGYSNIKATISTSQKATANKYASMSSYKMFVGNKNTTANYSSNSAINMTINSVSTNSVSVTAYDSRGFSRSVTKSLTNVGYTSPVIDTLNATLTRSNNGVGEQVTLSFDGTYWNQSFGVVTNTIKKLTYNYKTTSDSNWHYDDEQEPSILNDMTTSGSTFSYSHLIAGPTQSHGFDISTTYNIKINWADELSSGSFVLTLGAGQPKIAVSENGVAINQKYDNNNNAVLQVNGNLDVNGLITVQGGSSPSYIGVKGDKGDTGSQGPKGDKGDKGDTGNDGKTLWAMEVDSNGNLYCIYEETSDEPEFDYDSTNGNLYVIIDD